MYAWWNEFPEWTWWRRRSSHNATTPVRAVKIYTSLTKASALRMARCHTVQNRPLYFYCIHCQLYHTFQPNEKKPSVKKIRHDLRGKSHLDATRLTSSPLLHWFKMSLLRWHRLPFLRACQNTFLATCIVANSTLVYDISWNGLLYFKPMISFLSWFDRSVFVISIYKYGICRCNCKVSVLNIHVRLLRQ